jgi:hypothetical protein
VHRRSDKSSWLNNMCAPLQTRQERAPDVEHTNVVDWPCFSCPLERVLKAQLTNRCCNVEACNITNPVVSAAAVATTNPPIRHDHKSLMTCMGIYTAASWSIVIPFSAFWLRSSVVSVLRSLIASTGSNASFAIKSIFLGVTPVNGACSIGVTAWSWHCIAARTVHPLQLHCNIYGHVV